MERIWLQMIKKTDLGGTEYTENLIKNAILDTIAQFAGTKGTNIKGSGVAKSKTGASVKAKLPIEITPEVI